LAEISDWIRLELLDRTDWQLRVRTARATC